MARCNCSPLCPNCSDGPCDCTCTKKQIAEAVAKQKRRREAATRRKELIRLMLGPTDYDQYLPKQRQEIEKVFGISLFQIREHIERTLDLLASAHESTES